MRIAPIARQRRHTLLFLREIRSFAPVMLDTEVDMTAVRAHRDSAGPGDRRCSTVTYVLHAASRVLATRPGANAAIRGRYHPKIAFYDTVNGKFTMDRTMGGQRVVLSTVLCGLERSGLAEIQRKIDHFRDGDPDTMPEFAPTRLLHRLPALLGTLVFLLGVRPLHRRATTMGTFAVTSLGHRPVDGFFSVGGATITLGLGRIVDRPVVHDGQITVAPMMRLNLTFDHRVLDGAEAADVLTEIKLALESCQFVEAHGAKP